MGPSAATLLLLAAATLAAQNTAQNITQPATQPAPFTIQQALSAPYATDLTAAPQGNLFAWVEDAEGRHTLWVGGPGVAARQLTPTAEDDAQAITQLAWSPDGAAIAYTCGAESGADGLPANPAHLQRPTPLRVMVAAVEGGRPPVAVAEGHAPLFSQDGRALYFVHQGQIWIAATPAVATASCAAAATACTPPAQPLPAPRQLVFDRGSAHSLTLSPDGQTLAFISRRSEPNQPAHSFLALFALPSHTLTFAAPSTSNDTAPAWSPDGQALAWLRSPFTDSPEFALDRVAANPWSLQLLDRATGVVRQLFAPEANQPGSVLPRMGTGEPRLWWARDAHGQPGRLVFASEATGWVHLYALDPRHPGLPRLLTPGDYEVEDPTLSADGRTLVYAANDPLTDPLHPDRADADRRHLWGLDMTAAQPAPVFLTRGPGIEVHPALTADGGTLAALVADARTPMLPAVISADGVRQPLRPGALPADYPLAAMVQPAPVTFTAADGVTVHGQLFLGSQAAAASTSPQGHNPTRRATGRAAVIFLHGGPQQQMLLGYPARGYYSNAYALNEYLAADGFLVLSVNYRCGTGYGLVFRQCAGAGPTGASEYADVLAAVAYLRSRPDVDPRRIGLWGGSYGGYLTALGLARNSDLFAAGVDFHGVHDWNWEDNAGDWLRGSNAERDTIAARARASSPIAAVAHWTSPVLLLHGDDDPNVAYAQTPRLAEALRARGVRVQELIFPDEVHGFLLHKDWLAAYTAAAAFFERTLKP